jgi:preprotein translocase subunit SecY
VIIVGLIVFVEQAIRKISVQYARRVRGTETVQSSYLPLKINQSGVMPIIFASALLTFPSIIGQVVLGVIDPANSLYETAVSVLSLPIFNYQTAEYIMFYFVLIIIFTFFYAFIVMKPEDTADNLKKSGGFVPGIRPGTATRKYITSVMLRLATAGSIFLGIIAVLPNILMLTEQGANLNVLVLIGGSSILIIVSVVVDTYRQMKSLRVTRSYEIYK